jgi:hypothetical protein
MIPVNTWDDSLIFFITLLGLQGAMVRSFEISWNSTEVLKIVCEKAI